MDILAMVIESLSTAPGPAPPFVIPARPMRSPPSAFRDWRTTHRPIFGALAPTTIQLGAFWPIIIFGVSTPEHPAHPHSGASSVPPASMWICNPGFHPLLPGSPTFPETGMSMLFAGIPDFTHLPERLHDRPTCWQLNSSTHPAPVFILTFPAVPGSNTTGAPSSGFFNPVQVSGFGNVGAMVRRRLNQAPRRCWVGSG